MKEGEYLGVISLGSVSVPIKAEYFCFIYAK